LIAKSINPFPVALPELSKGYAILMRAPDGDHGKLFRCECFFVGLRKCALTLQCCRPLPSPRPLSPKPDFHKNSPFKAFTWQLWLALFGTAVAVGLTLWLLDTGMKALDGNDHATAADAAAETSQKQHTAMAAAGGGECVVGRARCGDRIIACGADAAELFERAPPPPPGTAAAAATSAMAAAPPSDSATELPRVSAPASAPASAAPPEGKACSPQEEAPFSATAAAAAAASCNRQGLVSRMRRRVAHVLERGHSSKGEALEKLGARFAIFFSKNFPLAATGYLARISYLDTTTANLVKKK
jgi:hypothetical protein